MHLQVALKIETNGSQYNNLIYNALHIVLFNQIMHSLESAIKLHIVLVSTRLFISLFFHTVMIVLKRFSI